MSMLSLDFSSTAKWYSFVLVREEFLLELRCQCLMDMADDIDIPFHFSSFSGWSCNCFNIILSFSGTGRPKCDTFSRRDKPSLEM